MPPPLTASKRNDNARQSSASIIPKPKRGAAEASASLQTINRLSKITPGGVNSPFRAFEEVGEKTVIFSKGKGSRIWDLNGKSYIDYLGAWGPAILGHAHPQVVRAACNAIQTSSVLGLSTRWELEMAELVRDAFPSMDMVRFVNSGAEAVDAAVRLARGFTRRSAIVRFEGGYHGHGDSVIWGYGPEENHAPSECGVPPGLAQETLTVPFNDAAALKKLFRQYGNKIAALLVEPVTGSMSVILPPREFLKTCRQLTRQYGALLIFDEVLTGFRIAFGGAQERFRVKADLTCLGKIVGGGLPAGAYGGPKKIMQRLAPLGPVYQAGTFSGNPVTMRAGIATLKILKKPGIYARLEQITNSLLSGFQKLSKKYGIPLQTPHAGSLFSISFSSKPILNYRDSLKINHAVYRKFFSAMFNLGVLFPPSSTDAAVMSLAHSSEDVRLTLKAFEQTCQTLAA